MFFAIKEAIAAARKEENLDANFYMQSPATSARIRMACQDEITKNVSWTIFIRHSFDIKLFSIPQFNEAEEGTWNVVP